MFLKIENNINFYINKFYLKIIFSSLKSKVNYERKKEKWNRWRMQFLTKVDVTVNEKKLRKKKCAEGSFQILPRQTCYPVPRVFQKLSFTSPYE